MSVHRELNPELFGTPSALEGGDQPVDPTLPATRVMGRAAEPAPKRTMPYLPGDLKALESQVNTLRVGLMQMEKRTEAAQSQIQELARGTAARLERFAAALARMEEAIGQHHQENTAKFAQVVAKVNERKVTDSKVQELLDRHNHIVRNFENRLISLQRLVSEQEMALHNSQAALEEARNEIARLKRL
jgi:chromosome segregation ATPase